MINTLLGIKKGMTAGYDTRGRRAGATIIEVAPNVVTQIKTTESKDGYNAVQIATGSKKSVLKPQQGHFKKAGASQNLRWMREVRVEGDSSATFETIQPGQAINLSQVFSKGDVVAATATSKGKGFQGGVRRHGFAGGPKTHGQSDRHRAPGSIGSGTTPGRVLKGKRMAGHMGVDRVTYKNLEVLSLDKENNLITIKGGIPGPIGGLVVLTRLGRVKGYTPPPQPEADRPLDEEPEPEPRPEDDQPLADEEVTENKEGEENAS